MTVHLMLNTAACVRETKAFYVAMLLELKDKWRLQRKAKDTFKRK